MTFMRLPYLSRLSTELLDNRRPLLAASNGNRSSVELPVVEPLDRSTIWPYKGGEPGAFYYQRYAHPTGVAAERALGELEGGEALLFPSGSGATTALVLALLEPGQTIALAEGAYYGTALLFRELERWGVRFTEFDQTKPPP